MECNDVDNEVQIIYGVKFLIKYNRWAILHTHSYHFDQPFFSCRKRHLDNEFE